MRQDPRTPPEAQLISERRQQRGLSIREAARRASTYSKVSEGTWRRYEAPGGATRESAKVAAMAAALSITPAELTAASRADAAAELETLTSRVAARPDIASLPGGDAGGDGWTALMGEILAGLGDIDAEDLPEDVKRDLRQELIAGIARDVAERRRHLRALRQITTGTTS